MFNACMGRPSINFRELNFSGLLLRSFLEQGGCQCGASLKEGSGAAAECVTSLFTQMKGGLRTKTRGGKEFYTLSYEIKPWP